MFHFTVYALFVVEYIFKMWYYYDKHPMVSPKLSAYHRNISIPEYSLTSTLVYTVYFRRQSVDNHCEWPSSSKLCVIGFQDCAHTQLQHVCWTGDAEICVNLTMQTVTPEQQMLNVVLTCRAAHVFVFQVNAVTSSAEFCEQHVSYMCYKSRLLNLPGKRC